MTNVYFDLPITDDERRARVYDGDIFVQSPNASSLALVDLARRMLEDAAGGVDPRRLHETMAPGDLAALLADLKPAFIHHPDCKTIIPDLLESLGCDRGEVYFDVPRLRSAYPQGHLSTGIAYAFHPHRDTWYSAPMCQINWWLPIYPLSADNCLAFYPRHFSEPVKNSSDGYNYYRWNAERGAAARHVGQDARRQPEPVEPVQGPDLRIVPLPGAVVVFSAAHLHGTVENTSGVARYSIDFRTVHSGDAAAGRGARNIDAHCTGTTIRDYLSARDLSHLPDAVIARHDDGTGQAPGAVLNFNEARMPGRAAAEGSTVGGAAEPAS